MIIIICFSEVFCFTSGVWSEDKANEYSVSSMLGRREGEWEWYNGRIDIWIMKLQNIILKYTKRKREGKG